MTEITKTAENTKEQKMIEIKTKVIRMAEKVKTNWINSDYSEEARNETAELMRFVRKITNYNTGRSEDEKIKVNELLQIGFELARQKIINK